MSNLRYQLIDVFLAHAVALERDAVEHLNEVAQMMAVHNNQPLYELFRELAGYGVQHAKEIEELAAEKDLPTFKPWEYEWLEDESPEGGDLTKLQYLMKPLQALKFALNCELNARAFYLDIANHAETEEIRLLANEFADEESEHVRLLEERMDKIKEVGKDWEVDLDPPHLPE